MRQALRGMAAYLLLLAILILGLWIFLLGREVFSGLLRAYFVGESLGRGYRAGLYDRVFLLVVGLSWLILFIVAEELLRRGVKKGNIFRVFSRFVAIEILLIAGLDGTMLLFLHDFFASGWIRWAILAGELVFGSVFVFLGWFSPLQPGNKR